MIELRDGSIFLARMLIHSSHLKQQANDDAPSDLVTMVSRDSGRTWGDQRTFLTPGPGETAAYHPALCRLNNGEILFVYEMFHRFVQNERPCVSAYAVRSRDECQTFSPPEIVWSRSSNHFGSQGDVRQLSTGRIIIPACYMEGTALQDDGKGLAPTSTSKAGCFYSDDGHEWKECSTYAYLPMRGTMEPKIEELNDGRLLMVMRNQLGSVFKSYSDDGGANWSMPQTTGLVSPECCPGLRRIPQTGDLLLIWNHNLYDPKFDHYGLRNPLTVALSSDEGETWSHIKNIETNPEWEYTNPAMIITRDGKLLVTYEASQYETLIPPGRLGRSQMHLKLAVIDLQWLYA